MDQTSWVVCQSLLIQCTPEKRSALFKLLPKNKQEEIQAIVPAWEDPMQTPDPLERQLENIHASWLAPYLRTFSESEIRLFISSLKDSHAKELQKTLLFTNHVSTLTPIAKRFFQKTLWEYLGGDKELPLSCLPSSNMNELLKVDPAVLQKVIFCLGLHDLGQEIRQIIDTAKLRRIQAALSPEESHYLKALMQKKEPVTFKKISLAQWNGDIDTLRKTIQGRGLNRLAKAVYGEHESFVWYLSHRLEMETASQFLKLSTPIEPAQAREALAGQVEELLAMFHTPTLGKTE